MSNSAEYWPGQKLPEQHPEQEPQPRPHFDQRFVTDSFVPRIVAHNGASIRVHETSSLPLQLEAYLFYESGYVPEGIGKIYYDQMVQDPIMLSSLKELKADEEMYELAGSAVYKSRQESDEAGGDFRLHMAGEELSQEQAAQQARERAQLYFDLSVLYVFLADKSRQLEPGYDIDNFRR